MRADEQLVDHFNETYRRLTNTRRHNTAFCNYPENVASHSFFVVYITMMLADTMKDCGDFKVQVEKAMRIAVLHDVEESFSGDILATMKMEDATFRKSLEIINERIMSRLFGRFGGSDAADYIGLWRLHRVRQDLEGCLVYIADTIALICYTGNEVSMGNSGLEEQFINGMRRLRRILRDKRFAAIDRIANELEVFYGIYDSDK